MNNVKNYELEFNDAIVRTKSWGLICPNFNESSVPYITDSSLKIINVEIQKILGQFYAEQISQQCFNVTILIQSKLEKLLKTELIYTLGYVDFMGKSVFYTNENQLKQKINLKSDFSPLLNLHAWLTTPYYEIIDFTFGTTFGVVTNQPDCIGASSLQHYSKFNNDMIYHPQLVGHDYLKKTGGIIELYTY